ncbi:MAG: HD family phosphohydrolase [Bacteroidales bacterium]
MMFIVAIVLILYVFPREGKFRYEFAEGKPWHYGLLTASYDFPIYKPEKQIKKEQDSILRYYQPYYQIQDSVAISQLKRFKVDFNSFLFTKATPQYYIYVESELKKIYASGILLTQAKESFSKDGITSLILVKDATGKPVSVDQIFSVREAYEKIISDMPSTLNRAVLQSMDVSDYLHPNLIEDTRKSQQAKRELLAKISNASGMVQTDERIIDKGEIVSPRTFNILYSLKKVTEERSGSINQQIWALIGEILLVIGLFINMFLYLRLFRYSAFVKKKMILFILIMIVSLVLLTASVSTMRLFSIYFVPYAIVPLVVRTFFDSRTALFTHIITILISSFMAPFPYEFLFLQLTVGMTAIYTLRDLTERSQLVRSAAFIFLTYVVFYTAYTLHQDGDWTRLNWRIILAFFVNGCSLLFTYLLIYIFEKTFGFVSNVTLVELSNINLPILREFSEVCPGTFQHSLQVSNLAADAALKINANAALVRTGALYHDIGKMENPVFFTENQSGVNPHDKLEYEVSAQIVIEHVSNGLRIAKKIGLPEAITDFILTHHGDSKAKYFYYSFKNKYPDRKVNDERFTYPGPKPFTKELALVMMADAVEAASRSLKEYTEASISELVERIIDSQIAEGMFKNASITFQHVEIVKRCFIEKLKIIYHTRISYPTLTHEEGSELSK